MTDDKVKALPVKFKQPGPVDKTLVGPHEVDKQKCMHSPFLGASFVVDASLAEVECSLCHEKLNPMWVLGELTKRDSRFHEAHRRYHEETKRLKERSSTKCQCCGKMTRISDR